MIFGILKSKEGLVNRKGFYFLLCILFLMAILAACAKPKEMTALPPLMDTQTQATKRQPLPTDGSVPPAPTMTQIVTLIPLVSPSPVATDIQVGAPLAGLETPSFEPQLIEAAKTPGAIATLGLCRLDPVSQPPWPVKDPPSERIRSRDWPAHNRQSPAD